MKILVLEDDATLLKLISMVLMPLGHIVLKATTAEEAFQRFDESDRQIDLLIADVSVETSSGIRVALEFRALLPHLRIIVTSGYPPQMWNDQDAAELSELPSDSVATLQKPFAPASLLETVAQFIGMTSTTAEAD